ncbi:unnamed protein product, partial [Ectocarpus fasciculatus]
RKSAAANVCTRNKRMHVNALKNQYTCNSSCLARMSIGRKATRRTHRPDLLRLRHQCTSSRALNQTGVCVRSATPSTDRICQSNTPRLANRYHRHKTNETPQTYSTITLMCTP